MIYGSVCSGIEAATAAWHPLGWKPAYFSEIDKPACAVLRHHYPSVPLHGDFTTIGGNEYGAINLLVGGTPCQAFSVAGLRRGSADSRGNLTLEFLRLAKRQMPRWVVWENVPGVLSLDKGRAFGSFLGGLAECGYGFAYRILDAQYFGVPQRRRRVFVVGHLGDWRRAAAVLFERESLQGDITPRRESREEFAPDFTPSLVSNGDAHSGFRDEHGLAAYSPSSFGSYGDGGGTLKASGGDIGGGSETLIAAPHISHCLNAGKMSRQDAESETFIAMLGHSQSNGLGINNGDTAFTLEASASRNQAASVQAAGGGMRVRRLTPMECERLQGFPDHFTAVPYGNKGAMPDGQRYKMLGNSMAVPVMRWIGERIALFDK